MGSVTIRDLDPATTARLRERATRRGRSMAAEARHILEAALTDAPAAAPGDLYARVRARFAPLGGVELDLPAREAARPPPRPG